MAANHRMTMMSKQRLTKEFRQIVAEPIDSCVIRIDPKDIFQWYYVIDGVQGTGLQGGKYLGRISFPPEYPMKPPTVYIDTPNGLIQTGESICMSMTSWHPESWDPSWGPRTIVLGLFVFLEDVDSGREFSATMLSPRGDVKALAHRSKAYTATLPKFKEIFPDLEEEWTKESGTKESGTKESETKESETKESEAA